MKILKTDEGALTNFEVLEFLKSKGATKDLAWFLAKVTPSEYKVFDYLIDSPASTQTRESIDEFKEQCKQYDIGKDKIINIINIRPGSVVEIYAIIEENADELVQVVETVLPCPPIASSNMLSVEQIEQEVGGNENAEVPMETS